jgi:hypothetical protein
MYMKRNRYFSGVRGLLLACALVLGTCSLDADVGDIENIESSGGGEVPVVPTPPDLLSQAVSYDAAFVPTVVFTFNKGVNAVVQTAGWAIVGGNGSAAVSVAPTTVLVSGGIETVMLNAANVADETKVLTVAAEVITVSGFFVRPDEGAECTYTVVRYGETSGGDGIVLLRADGSEEEGYLVRQGLRTIFNAVYTPNAPETTDNIEDEGVKAVVYTDAISEQVLALFKITVAAQNGGDRIEIRGTDLPAATAEKPLIDQWHPVVIDIGVSDTVDLSNEGLPVFSIPAGALGEASDYRHIRLRVNRGAALVIEADDTGNPVGLMTGSTVEVRAGGSLRNGASRGHALGTGSVIIARLGSRLATGPRPTGEAAEDWIIGSVNDDARVCWGGGDQNGSYIEIREGKLAFDVNVTVKKSLTLHHSVWFIKSPTLTIGTGSLTAEDDSYHFYGTFFQTGGVNPARPAAKIVIMPGGAISRSLLEAGSADDSLVNTNTSEIIISNKGEKGSSVEVFEASRSGYWNWSIPAGDF